MTIGKRIRQLRDQHHYSQDYLADRLSVSRQAVSKWERDVSSPDMEHLIALAELFDVSVDTLASGSDRAGEADGKKDMILRRCALIFFLIALFSHCAGLFSGEFTRNLIPIFPYLWYGTSPWAVVLNIFTVLLTVVWITLLSIAAALRRRADEK